MTRRTQKCISLLLAGSLTTASPGCYTLRTVAHPGAAEGKTINIQTAKGAFYELRDWEILPGGDIRGRGIKKVYISGNQTPVITDFEGTLDRLTIRQCSVEEFDLLGTTVAVLGATASIGLIGLFVWILADPPHIGLQ